MKIAFCNLDFATGQRTDRNTVELMVSEGYQYLGLVECKFNDVNALLPRRWKVHQVMKNAATMGSVTAWDPWVVQIDRVVPLRVGVRPRGVRMLTRYLSIVDVVIGKHVVRIIVGHWPPPRYRWLQPIYTANVKRYLRNAPEKGRWVVMADFNMHHDKAARQLGGHSHGYKIDGIVCGPRMLLARPWVSHRPQRQGWTDHPAIGGVLQVF